MSGFVVIRRFFILFLLLFLFSCVFLPFIAAASPMLSPMLQLEPLVSWVSWDVCPNIQGASPYVGWETYPGQDIFYWASPWFSQPGCSARVQGNYLADDYVSVSPIFSLNNNGGGLRFQFDYFLYDKSIRDGEHCIQIYLYRLDGSYSQIWGDIVCGLNQGSSYNYSTTIAGALMDDNYFYQLRWFPLQFDSWFIDRVLLFQFPADVPTATPTPTSVVSACDFVFVDSAYGSGDLTSDDLYRVLQTEDAVGGSYYTINLEITTTVGVCDRANRYFMFVDGFNVVDNPNLLTNAGWSWVSDSFDLQYDLGIMEGYQPPPFATPYCLHQVMLNSYYPYTVGVVIGSSILSNTVSGCSPAVTSTPTMTATATPTMTATPLATPVVTATVTPTPTVIVPTPTYTVTVTPTPRSTPTANLPQGIPDIFDGPGDIAYDQDASCNPPWLPDSITNTLVVSVRCYTYLPISLALFGGWSFAVQYIEVHQLLLFNVDILAYMRASFVVFTLFIVIRLIKNR